MSQQTRGQQVDGKARRTPRQLVEPLRGLPRAFIEDPAGTVFLLSIAGLFALALVGLPLAILGWFVPWLVIPTGLAAWLVLVVVGLILTEDGHARKSSPIVSVVALYIAATFGIFAAVHSSEHVLTDRDPGVYVVTGKWLAHQGTLIYDAGLPAEAIKELDRSAWQASGMYARPDGSSYFQFAHLLPVVLATAHFLGGDALMLNTPAIVAAIALLGVFVVARGIASGPAGLLAMGVMVLHPASLHFAKDAHSEWPSLALTLAGFWFWSTGGRGHKATRYALVGALIAGGTLARIDGWLTIAAFFIGVSYVVFTEREEERTGITNLGWMVVGAGLVGALAWADLVARSPSYLGHLWPNVRLMLLATVASMVGLVSVLAVRRQIGRRVGKLTRTFAAWAGAGGVAAAGSYALFIRPDFPVRSESAIGLVGGLQAREGVDVDPYRTYAESSLEWFTWYQGRLFVILTVLAVSLAVFVLLRSRGDRRVPIVTTLVGTAVVYLWRPSITPDHLWAMRRYLAIVLPIGAIVLAWAIAHLAQGGRRRGTAVLLVAGLPLSLGGVTMLRVGAPIATVRTQVGMMGLTRDLCRSLPDDSAILFEPGLGFTYSVAVRGFCDVPVARGLTAQQAIQLSSTGLTPVAISSSSSCLAGEFLGAPTTTYTFPERTIERPPAGYENGTLTAYMTRLPTGNEALEPAIIPGSATGYLEIAVELDALPTEPTVLASIGDPPHGLWLEIEPDGRVLLSQGTADGPLTMELPGRAAGDGLTRVYGGYLTDELVVALCAAVPGQTIQISATPEFTDTPIRVIDESMISGRVVVLQFGSRD